MTVQLIQAKCVFHKHQHKYNWAKESVCTIRDKMQCVVCPCVCVCLVYMSCAGCTVQTAEHVDTECTDSTDLFSLVQTIFGEVRHQNA